MIGDGTWVRYDVELLPRDCSRFCSLLPLGYGSARAQDGNSDAGASTVGSVAGIVAWIIIIKEVLTCKICGESCNAPSQPAGPNCFLYALCSLNRTQSELRTLNSDIRY